MPPRAPPRSSPLARLLDPSLRTSALRAAVEEVGFTYAHAVVFRPAAIPVLQSAINPGLSPRLA
jgi:hypothetical protein